MKKILVLLALSLFVSSCSAYVDFMNDKFGPGEKRTTWAPPELDIAEGYNYFIIGVVPECQYVNLFYPFEDEAVWTVYSGGWSYQYGAFRKPASPFYLATHRYSNVSSSGEVLKFQSKDLLPEMTNRDLAMGGKVIMLAVKASNTRYGVTASVYDVSSAQGAYYLEKAKNQEPIVMYGKLFKYF
jgi:hypothetical protein